MAGPRRLLLVPPDEGLPGAPRLAVRISRCAVVEDAAVGRPPPPPLVRDPVLLLRRLPARGLVHAVCVDAAIDPATAGRGTVIVELLVRRQWLPPGTPPVDPRQAASALGSAMAPSTG